MNKETIEIPLVKATYEELQQVICELQVERYIKDKEIERLNNIINKAIEYIEEDIKGNYFKRYDDEVYKMCEDLLGILKGSGKSE